jgi:DNA-binding NtrC family response regulator
MSKKPPKILIVGGDIETREGMFSHLLKRKFDCVMASSMDNAKLLLMRRPFDLVFCELKLTDGSGLALCQQIRQRYPDTAVVVTSEPVARRYEADAQQRGAAAFLRKPFQWKELDQLIHTVLPLQ